MNSEGDVKPEQRPSIGKILAVIACLIAVATSGGASIHFVINEARFPVTPVIQFLGSLLATWGAVTYKNPVDRKKGAGAKNV
ncbi:MAG: hypothetical protein ABGZ53_30640 [Fuerstiella sp.]